MLRHEQPKGARREQTKSAQRESLVIERVTEKRILAAVKRSLKGLLPEGLKQALRPLPQWVPVALDAPQDAVEISLSAAGLTVDATRICVVASLTPFRVAANLSGAAKREAWNGKARLSFRDLSTQEIVAHLDLVLNHTTQLDTGVTLAIFDIASGSHRCTRWPYRAWNNWLQGRALRRKSHGTAGMTPHGVQHTMIFYICPRPVVLVSVADASHSNLFPMDLIGPVSEDRFTLALRSTSASIPTMKATRRVTISDMPAALTPMIFKLGEHHKKPSIDWSTLPFRMSKTRVFSLPHPENALRVRELEILTVDEIGSHTFFVTRMVSDTRCSGGKQLFHVNGNYQHYRAKRLQPFVSAG